MIGAEARILSAAAARFAMLEAARAAEVSAGMYSIRPTPTLRDRRGTKRSAGSACQNHDRTEETTGAGPNELKDSLISKSLTVPVQAWRTVAATTAVAMLLCNAHRSAFSLLVPQVAAHFELAASDVGMLQSAMLVGYLVGQLPAGRLSDSLGGERVMIGSLLLWSISLVASGAVTSLPSLLLTRAAMGLFSACAMPGVSAMAAAWVPQASRSGVVAAIYAVFNLGGVVGMLVVPWLASAAGWRGALAWAGAAGVTWACVATVTLWRLVSGHPHRPCNDKITVNSASPLTAPTMLVSTAAATAASMSKAGSVAKAGTAWNSAPDLTAVAPASSSLEEPMFGEEEQQQEQQQEEEEEEEEQQQ
ncbi:hypothetical protein QJQ45_016042 [Haematococcus lacustris]|nr:hypothetical protein QJQ45_016042 [Haematococcus lacustris]